MAEACMITCAVSGAVANKQQCPGIPYTRSAGPATPARRWSISKPGNRTAPYRGRRALPGRDPGHPRGDAGHHRQLSTGWVGLPMAERVAHISELRPENGALNMGSMNYAKYSPKRKGFVFNFVFENSFDDIIFLLQRKQEVGVKPECECFDVGHVESVEPLVDLGVLRPPVQFSLIHGVLGGISATAGTCPTWRRWFRRGRRGGSSPSAGTIGAGSAPPRPWGGNVRVGFEDDFYLPSGEMASSNGDLVEAAAQIVGLQGREVAGPEQARRLLSLLPNPDRGTVLAT
jgi:3-keto-5-aminohexanoate cleavage enzyme